MVSLYSYLVFFLLFRRTPGTVIIVDVVIGVIVIILLDQIKVTVL
jgi:hypothetical protein